jgi:predicted amidophosphoribosyltransferase
MKQTFCDQCGKNITNDYIHKGTKDYCPQCFLKLTEHARIVTFADNKIIDVTHLFNPNSDTTTGV